MKTRIIPTVTAALLLLSIFLVLGACTTNGEKDKGSSSGSFTEGSEDSRYTPNVPEGISFDGATFSVLSIDPSLYASTITDFDFDESPEDVVQEAIYNRNRKIEAEYGVEFESTYVNNLRDSPNFANAMDCTGG